MRATASLEFASLGEEVPSAAAASSATHVSHTRSSRRRPCTRARLLEHLLHTSKPLSRNAESSTEQAMHTQSDCQLVSLQLTSISAPVQSSRFPAAAHPAPRLSFSFSPLSAVMSSQHESECAKASHALATRTIRLPHARSRRRRAALSASQSHSVSHTS